MTQLKQRYRQRLIWIAHWSKNDRNGSRDMAKWFCYTTMLRLTHQDWRKTPWNRLDETSFRPRHILWPGAIWLSPLCINGTRACRTALQQFRRSLKMAHRMVCQFFWRGIHNLPERWPKCVEADGQSLNKQKMKFPWKLFVSFTTKTYEYTW